MRLTLLILFICISAITVSAQNANTKVGKLDNSKPLILTHAACGECKLGLKGKSCDLAVRINGKSYFVDGVHIDSLGDAHAKDGFCNSIRKAQVQGEIKNDRFVASYFYLLPSSAKKKLK
ncbi:MAG: DUF6370 family protein [Ginsengibacter sp.]